MVARIRRAGRTFASLLLLAPLILVTGLVVGATPVAAAPGTPGTPQAPVALFAEDFENGIGTTPVLLTDYTGAAPTSTTYTAAAGWLSKCNGYLVRWGSTPMSATDCTPALNFGRVQQLARALGMYATGTDGITNHAVTAYTQAPNNANGLIQLATATNLDLPSVDGRFLTFSVDTAALNCNVSAPLYQFSFVSSGGAATPVGGVVNGCSSSQTVNVPALTANVDAVTARVGRYTSNGSVLITGSSVGVRVVNNNGAANGNDAAIDNLQILDVTPQLDKAFSPAAQAVGAPVTLTFTVTNTTELAAKNGWSFTDALPAGLVVSGTTASTTCPGGTVTAARGGTSVQAGGNLAAGMASCTVTVQVTSWTAGSYTNGPGDVASVGLNPPGDTTVTFEEGTAWSCGSEGYLFQSPNATTHTVTAVDLATGQATPAGDTTGNVNGVGYNSLDNYMYGYHSETGQVTRISPDGSLVDVGAVPPLVGGYSMGDFDDAGHLYMTQNTANGRQPWVEVDLAPGSATYGTVVASGTLTIPQTQLALGAADWSWIDGAFYAISNNNANNAVLWRWTPGAGQTVNLGQVGFNFVGNIGATYADGNGYLYGAVNSSGAIYRVDLETLTSIRVATGPAASSNDGARCTVATIATITVSKVVTDRAAVADQFSVGLRDSTGTVLTSATTSGTGTAATTEDWPVDEGATYTITDAMSAGPSSLSAYATSLVCTDTTTGETVTTGGEAAAWTLEVTTGDAYSCVVTNAPRPAGFSVTKTASVAAANPGDTVTYSVAVTNTGPVAYTAANPASFTDSLDDVLDDADYVAGSAAATGGTVGYTAPTLAWSGPLAVGATVTVTYRVIVTDPDTGDGTLTNTVVTPPGSGGTCAAGSADPACTSTVPVRSFSVVKTADVDAANPGDTVTYTVTVTNTGDTAYPAGAPASFADDLSAVLDDATYNDDAAASGGPAPTFAGSALSWSGALAVGAVVTITYTVTVDDPDTGDQALGNTVVTPPGSGGSCPAGSADATCTATVAVRSFSVVKTADVDAANPGDTVTYTVTVTNTGDTAYPAGAPASFADDLSSVLDDATYNDDAAASGGPAPTFAGSALSWSGALAVGAVVTITYTVTVDDPDTGDQALGNTVVTPPGSGGSCPAGSAEPTCTATVAVRSFSVVKSASVSATNSGDTITYTVTVENTGTAAYTAADPASFTDNLTTVLDDATYNDDAAASTGPAPTYAEPTLSWSGPLAVGGTVTITYTVTVDDPDTGDQALDNTVVTPPGSGGTCPTGSADPDCSTTVPIRSYTVAKSTTATEVTPGDTITYTVTVTNTGEAAYTAAVPASFKDDLSAVLDDATYNADATTSAGPDPTYTAPTLSWSGPLAVGATVTMTYTITVNDPDAGDKHLDNAVVTPPSSGGDCPASSTEPHCSVHLPARVYTVTKSASQAAANPGDTITYTLTLTNTGSADYTDQIPAFVTDDLSAVTDDATYNDDAAASTGPVPTYAGSVLSWSGPLAVDATVTITYSVTVNDPAAGDGILDNAAVTPPGSGGSCPAGSTDPDCSTSVPVRSFSMTKTTDSAAANPGDVVAYTLTVTNTGDAAYPATTPASFTDDLSAILDDATYNNDAAASAGPDPAYAAPTLSWSGPLAVGQVVTITYTVTVDDPDAGDGTLDNAAVTPPGSGGSCPTGATDPDCSSSIPVRSFSVTKSADVAAANPGDVVTYTITVTNTGDAAYPATTPASFTDDLSAVLDDATYNDDASASTGPVPTYAGSVLSWSGPLAVDATVTLTYSVTVNDPDAGDASLDNTVVTPPGSGGSCPTGSTDPECSTSVPVRSFSVTKSADVAAANPGDVVTYTITVTNTGDTAYPAGTPASFADDLSAVLDDATYNDDAAASTGPAPTYAGSVLSWSGPLAVDGTVTITYSVTVSDPDAGDGTLDNAAVTPPGSGGSCPTGATDPDCSSSVPVRSFSVTKSADVSAANPGDVVTYTITVTNTGDAAYPATSPASFTDDLSAVLDDATYNDDAAASTGPAPTYAGSVLTWSGPLAVDALVTITYTVDVDDPGTGDRTMTNTALTPPGSGGDCPAGSAAPACSSEVSVRSFTITKSTTATEVTPGSVVTYTITLANTGDAAYTATSPASFTDDLTAVLDDADYNDDAASTSADVPSYVAPNLTWSGALPVDGTVTITYSVSVHDPDDGDKLLDNAVVTPPGSGGDCPEGSVETHCQVHAPNGAYSVTKSVSEPAANPGDTLVYTLTVTNTGPRAYTAESPASITDNLTEVLDDATYNGDAVASAGDPPTYGAPTLTWSGPLALAGTVTITYSVTVAEPASGDKHLVNTVTTPSGSGGDCPVGTTNAGCTTDTPVRAFHIDKVASHIVAQAGDVVTYTLTITNTGEAAYPATAPMSFADNMSGVLDDAGYNGDAQISGGPAPTVNDSRLSWSGPLDLGQTRTLTYSVTVTGANDHLLRNVVTTPPGSGGDCSTGSTDTHCLSSVPLRAYTVQKTASATAADQGDTIAYAVTLRNTGAVAYTDADPASFSDDLTDVLDDATYNGDATASTGPAPEYAAPTLTWSGPLGIGDTVTVTYSVTVHSPDTGDLVLDNTAVPPEGSGGECPIDMDDASGLRSSGAAFTAPAPLAAPDDPVTACHPAAIPVRAYTVTKASSAETAAPGDTVSYRITVTNTGKADFTTADPASFTDDLTEVVDDAAYNDDADQGATYADNLLQWSGALAVGQAVTVSYSVTVNDPTSGDGTMTNVVITPGDDITPPTANCAAGSTDPDCSTVTVITRTSTTQVTPPSTPAAAPPLAGPLPNTGTPVGPGTAAIGVLMVLAGAALLWVGRRGRRRTH